MKLLNILTILLLLIGIGFSAMCYQESANVSNQTGIDGSCGLSYTGTYNWTGTWASTATRYYDGNWSSSSIASGQEYVYVNYTKPTGSLESSLIQQCMGFSTCTKRNDTIPSSCWNYNTTTLMLKTTSNSSACFSNISCYNGSWVLIYNKTGTCSWPARIYEEAMWWNLSASDYVNINQSLPSNTTYTDYNIPFAVNCSGTEASYLVNITIDGVVNITNAATANNSLYQTNISIPQGGYHNTTATCSNSSTNTSSPIFFTVTPTITPGITAPANTTYGSLTIPLDVNCSGVYASYLVNITLDGVVNVTNQAVLNATAYITNKTFMNGGHNISINCWNVSNNSSSTVIFTTFDGPSVTFYTPLNGTTNLSSTIPFGFRATSPNDATLNCSIYINGTLNQSNSTYQNNTVGQFVISDLSNANNSWAVRCYGSLGNYGDSPTSIFEVYDAGGGGGVLEGQASEFMAAAITMVGLLWFFAFLYSRAADWLWKSVWLMACFLTAYMALGIMNLGFSNILASTELSDLAFAAMIILMYSVIILFGVLLLSLMLYALKQLKNAAEGKKGDDELGGGGE